MHTFTAIEPMWSRYRVEVKRRKRTKGAKSATKCSGKGERAGQEQGEKVEGLKYPTCNYRIALPPPL